MDGILEKLLLLWGPLALGWVFFAISFWFNLKDRSKEIDSRVKLAESLSGLSSVITKNNDALERLRDIVRDYVR